MYNKGMVDRVDFVESGYTTKTGFNLERGNVLEVEIEFRVEITLQESVNGSKNQSFFNKLCSTCLIILKFVDYIIILLVILLIILLD